MIKMKNIIVALLLCGLIGCYGKTDEERLSIDVKHAEKILPPNSKNISLIGSSPDIKGSTNNWFTFDLEIEGKNRKFMMGVFYTHGGWRVGSLIELR